ncbi:MAG: hypothetical protein K2X08_03800 [Chlamydiales bacterium]|nr:hypothetical protein [Chlamydiales bacterium]
MKLKDWLESKCISVPKFCKYNDFCEESIYAYIKGSVPRSSIALKIVKATAGQVSLEDLGLGQESIEKVRLKQQKLRDKKERQKVRNLEKSQEVSDSILTASGG